MYFNKNLFNYLIIKKLLIIYVSICTATYCYFLFLQFVEYACKQTYVINYAKIHCYYSLLVV